MTYIIAASLPLLHSGAKCIVLSLSANGCHHCRWIPWFVYISMRHASLANAKSMSPYDRVTVRWTLILSLREASDCLTPIPLLLFLFGTQPTTK